MAKTLKPDTAASAEKISREDLKRVITEISRQKDLASEYAGNAGKATANAVEKFGLEKNALTFARRLSQMEDAKRQSVLRALIDYAQKLGFFDQLDAFDDLVDTLQTIVDGAGADKGERKADPVIGALIN